MQVKQFSLLGRLFVDAGLSTCADILARLGALACTIILARVLLPEAFAVFVLGQTFSNYLWLAVDLGTTQSGTRMLALKKDDMSLVTGNVIGMRFAAIAALAALMPGMNFLQQTYGNNHLPLYPALAFLFCFALFPIWIQRGRKEFNQLATSVVATALSFLVGCLFMIDSPSDLILALLLWSGSYLTGLLTYVATSSYGFSIFIPRFDLNFWRQIFSNARLFLVTGLLTLAYQSATLLVLFAFATLLDTGQYSLSLRLVLALTGFAAVPLMAAFPHFVTAAGGSAPSVRRTQFMVIAISIILGLVVGAPFFLAGESIFKTFFGTDYAVAGQLMAVMAWALPLIFLRSASGMILQAGGHVKHHAMATLFGLAVCVVLSAALVPAYGSWGAAWAMLIAEATYCAWSVFGLRGLLLSTREDQSGQQNS